MAEQDTERGEQESAKPLEITLETGARATKRWVLLDDGTEVEAPPYDPWGGSALDRIIY